MRWLLCCYWYEPDAPSDPVGLVRLWALARQLVERGDSVTVFPPRYRSALLQRGFSTAPIPLLPWPVLRPITYAVLSCIVGSRAASVESRTVVYYRWMESPHPLLFARLSLARQCICEVNGEPVPPWGAGGWRGRLTHALASFALTPVRSRGRADGRIRPSRADTVRGARLIMWRCCRADRILALFYPRERNRCVQEAGLDPACEYIGFVGSFYQYQGLATLLEAFERLHARRSSVRLLMVGDGEEATALREQAAQRGLSPWITWTGRVPYAHVPTVDRSHGCVCRAVLRGPGRDVAGQNIRLPGLRKTGGRQRDPFGHRAVFCNRMEWSWSSRIALSLWPTPSWRYSTGPRSPADWVSTAVPLSKSGLDGRRSCEGCVILPSRWPPIIRVNNEFLSINAGERA